MNKRLPPLYIVAAMRGRENKQVLEFSNELIAHSLTTVQKDNLLIEVTQMNEENQPVFIGNYNGYGASYAGAVWDKNGISPTLTTMQGGGGNQ